MLDKDKLIEFLESEIMSSRIVGTGSDNAIEWECKRILERINAGFFDKEEKGREGKPICPHCKGEESPHSVEMDDDNPSKWRCYECHTKWRI